MDMEAAWSGKSTLQIFMIYQGCLHCTHRKSILIKRNSAHLHLKEQHDILSNVSISHAVCSQIVSAKHVLVHGSMCTRSHLLHSAVSFITAAWSRAELRPPSFPALTLNVSNTNDSQLVIYIVALLKSLAGVMKLAVSTGNTQPNKGISPSGGAASSGSRQPLWSVLCVHRIQCFHSMALDGTLGMKQAHLFLDRLQLAGWSRMFVVYNMCVCIVLCFTPPAPSLHALCLVLVQLEGGAALNDQKSRRPSREFRDADKH